MNLTNGSKSIILFAFAVLALLLLTLFESALAGLSISVERSLSFVLLVLPSLAGLGFGVFGMVNKEPRKWLPISGVVLNGIFAAFMTFVLSFAG